MLDYCVHNHAANGYNIITVYRRTAMVWECKVACDQALIKYSVRQNFFGSENKGGQQPLEPPLVPTPLLSKGSMLHVNSILIYTHSDTSEHTRYCRIKFVFLFVFYLQLSKYPFIQGLVIESTSLNLSRWSMQ